MLLHAAIKHVTPMPPSGTVHARSWAKQLPTNGTRP
jgi:hypothetical protein